MSNEHMYTTLGKAFRFTIAHMSGTGSSGSRISSANPPTPALSTSGTGDTTAGDLAYCSR